MANSENVIINVSTRDSTRKISIVANDFNKLIEKASRKLQIKVSKFVHLPNGNEIDENEVFQLILKRAINENKDIDLIALEENQTLSKEGLVIHNDPDHWRYANLIKALNQSEEVDICFLIDCTSSMTNEKIINKIKDLIDACIDDLKNLFNYLKLRSAFVGYRDFCDNNEQFVILDFVEDHDTFSDFVKKVIAKGGGDECEDVLGGLFEVTKLNWNHKSRMLLHIGDAPCHGRRFYDGELEDDHPNDDPRGYKISKILKKIKNLNITYFFMKTTDYTDKMIDEFNKELNLISAAEIIVKLLPSPDQLLKTFVTALTITISTSMKLTQNDVENKETKNIPIDKSRLNWKASNFDTYDAICYKFKFTGKLSTFRDLKKEFDIDKASGIKKKSKFFENIKCDCKKIKIHMCPVPFAKGNLRYAYAALLDNGKELIKCVAKDSLYVDEKTERFDYQKKSISIQLISKYLSKKFLNPGYNHLKFTNVKLIEISDKNGRIKYFSIEPFIINSFKKWNNNAGFVNKEIYALTLDAFSHWTYVATNGYLIVNDLQGIIIAEENGVKNYVLTDPAISCVDRQFLSTDLGSLGIRKYFSTHICNQFCVRLNLAQPEFQVNKNEIVPTTNGSSVIRPDFILDNQSDSNESREDDEDEDIF